MVKWGLVLRTGRQLEKWIWEKRDARNWNKKQNKGELGTTVVTVFPGAGIEAEYKMTWKAGWSWPQKVQNTTLSVSFILDADLQRSSNQEDNSGSRQAGGILSGRSVRDCGNDVGKRKWVPCSRQNHMEAIGRHMRSQALERAEIGKATGNLKSEPKNGDATVKDQTQQKKRSVLSLGRNRRMHWFSTWIYSLQNIWSSASDTFYLQP